jgi:sugar/nucleoside kinase (ribokinase family)
MIDVETTVGANRPALERILGETDIAGFNQDGFLAATGHPPSIEAAHELLDFGPHTVVVTRGAAGALTVTHDDVAEHPGFSVPVVDTTGAGDTFNAAFVAATLRGDPLAARLRFANAAGALSVTAMGPRGLLPTRDEIEAFLAVDGRQ